MQRDPRAFLWDVRESALAIQSFVAGMDMAAYAGNAMAQAAVERKFEIIGEALNQLAKFDAATAARSLEADLTKNISPWQHQPPCTAHTNAHWLTRHPWKLP